MKLGAGCNCRVFCHRSLSPPLLPKWCSGFFWARDLEASAVRVGETGTWGDLSEGCKKITRHQTIQGASLCSEKTSGHVKSWSLSARDIFSRSLRESN